VACAAVISLLGRPAFDLTSADLAASAARDYSEVVPAESFDVVWLAAWLVGCTESAVIGGLCGFDCNTQRGAIDAEVRDSSAQDKAVADGGIETVAEECQPQSLQLTRRRLELLVVVDDGATVYPWWPALRAGLVQFMQQPESKGIGMGLQKFGAVCEAARYSEPLVPIDVLPMNASAIEAQLPSVATGSTSTLPALEGALQYARVRASASPDADVIVVLMTDAGPDMCDPGDYAQRANALVSAELWGAPTISTHVLGVGNVAALEPLARSGGTQLSPISTLPRAFEVLTALENVRRAARPCEFVVPDSGSPTPKSRIYVQRTATFEILPRGTACNQDGFQLDEMEGRRRLIACPSTCAALNADDNLTLETACPSAER
jgi:hypothetical protein